MSELACIMKPHFKAEAKLYYYESDIGLPCPEADIEVHCAIDREVIKKTLSKVAVKNSLELREVNDYFEIGDVKVRIEYRHMCTKKYTPTGTEEQCIITETYINIKPKEE